MKRSRLSRQGNGKRTYRMRKAHHPFMKVVRVGTMQMNGRRASIHAKVSYDDKGNLSIRGVIGALPSGNALGGCGQIDMDFAHRDPKDNDPRYDHPIRPEEIKFAKGWDRNKWLDFLDAWKHYHLNYMNAGTVKQEKALREWRAKNPKATHDYDDEVKYLKSISLYDDGGYKYGTGWRRREVPKNVIAFLKSLPDADKEPAWV
jgi:hypothetical protein